MRLTPVGTISTKLKGLKKYISWLQRHQSIKNELNIFAKLISRGNFLSFCCSTGLRFLFSAVFF